MIDPQNVVTSTLTTAGTNNAWASSATSGSGTVTMTSFTATTASGTFSLKLDPVPGTGASGQKTVASGVFNVTCTNTTAPPSSLVKGLRISAAWRRKR